MKTLGSKITIATLCVVGLTACQNAPYQQAKKPTSTVAKADTTYDHSCTLCDTPSSTSSESETRIAKRATKTKTKPNWKPLNRSSKSKAKAKAKSAKRDRRTARGKSSGRTPARPLLAGAPKDRKDRAAQRRDGGMNWTERAYPTGHAATSPIGLKRGVPSEVSLNAPFSYQLIVSNLSDHTLHEVVLNEEMGSNFKLDRSEPSAARTDGGFAFNVGDLPAGEEFAITLTGRATGGSSLNGCAKISYEEQLCANIPVVTPMLNVTKKGPAETLLCHDITYVYNVSNAGTGAVRNVQIEDKLPAGLRTKDGQQTVSFNVAKLNAKASKRFTVKLRAEKRGVYTSNAMASNGSLTSKSGELTTRVLEPELTIAMSGPKKAFLGRPATYRVSVKNVGNGDARKAWLTLAKPAGAKLLRASDNGKDRAGQIRWDLGTLAPNASKDFTVTFKSTKAGWSSAQATSNAECCARKATAQARTQYVGIPAILLEVIDLEDPIAVGSDETYLITATNQGSAPGTNIVIECEIENAFGFVNATGVSRGSHANGKIRFAPLKSLAPKQKATWRVIVKAKSSADARFKVSMTSDQLTRPVAESEATNVYE